MASTSTSTKSRHSQIQRFVAQNHPRHFKNLVEIANTHTPIVEVLRSGKPDKAARAIQDHIMLIWSRMKPE